MYCRHCGVELLDWAKVCVMCGASTEDASPVPVEISSEANETTVLPPRSPRVEEAATRVVINRSRAERINVSAPDPSADDPTIVQPKGKKAAHSFENKDVLHMPPAVDKDEFAADDTGLFVNPDDDDRIYTEERQPTYPTEAQEPRDEAEPVSRTGKFWSTLQRDGLSRKANAKPRSKATRIAGIASAVVAVILLAVLAFVLFAPPSNSSSPTFVLNGEMGTQSESGLKVAIPVRIPSLDANGSRIPVHVSGQTETGRIVDEDAYISHDGNGLTLDSGSYEVRAVGSPISVDGVLYYVPDKSIEVKFVDGLVFTQNSSEKLTFQEIAAEETTLAQINAAYEWVANDPDRADRADQLLEAARRRRANAVAAIEKDKPQEPVRQQQPEETTVSEPVVDEAPQQQYTEPQNTTPSQYEGGYDEGGDVTGDEGSGSEPADNPGGDDSGTGDSGSGDTGTGDSGSDDSGSGDTGTGDSGSDDSGSGDAGSDSGSGDSGTGDSGTDSGTGDSGTGDSGSGDSGSDSGGGDSGTDSGSGVSGDSAGGDAGTQAEA